MMNTWYFDEEETKPLTGDEPIIVPHLLLMVRCERMCAFLNESTNTFIILPTYVRTRIDSRASCFRTKTVRVEHGEQSDTAHIRRSEIDIHRNDSAQNPVRRTHRELYQS